MMNRMMCQEDFINKYDGGYFIIVVAFFNRLPDILFIYRFLMKYQYSNGHRLWSVVRRQKNY